MKIRLAFVSNSSSASFSIKRKHLTPEQMEAIRSLGETHEANDFMPYREMYAVRAKGDFWDIVVTEDEILGRTIMDNMVLRPLLRKMGIPGRCLEWHAEDYSAVYGFGEDDSA